MAPIIGENEKNSETVVHKQQHKRKRSNSDTSLNLESDGESTYDIPERAIGKDGHYYVCVKCDNDGELLCCDSCACTYHLQCLDPPLKSTPEGVWQCPNCEEADISVQLINLKRAAYENRLSNNKDDGPYTCSLCAKTNKVLELSEDESDEPKSPKSNSKEDNLQADTDKGPKENQEGTSVCNADSCGTIRQKFPNNKPDKLLVLSKNYREVLLDSMKDIESEKSKQNNDDKTNAEPDSTADHAQAAQAWKEKYAKLRTRQKERICVGALSDLRSLAPKQRSDPQIVTPKESSPSRASPNRWGGARALLSSISLIGQNTTTSNTLLSRLSSTAMGVPLNSIAGTSSDANADSMIVVQTPTGLLKRKAHVTAWSEKELDALWIGVRRYGAGDWDAVRGDASLICLKNKTEEDLSARWNMELRKFLHPAPVPSVPNRSVPPLNSYSYPTWHPLSLTNQSVMWSSSISSISPSAGSFWCDNRSSTFSWAPQWSASTNKEPVSGELLLGGHFPLPNFGLNQNMNEGHSSREAQKLPKPDAPLLVIDVDDDSDDSEKTQS